MELKPIKNPEDFIDKTLQDRSERSCKHQLTKQYVAWENGQEVAFLALDIYSPKDFPGVDHYTIYEIFVPEKLRNIGIGSRVLAAAEQEGRNRGLQWARLSATPLDDGRTQEQLVEWYKRHGYTMMRDSSSTDMHKYITVDDKFSSRSDSR